MKKEFVPYEESLKLKELGFDDPCYSVYGYNLSEYEETGMNKRLVSIEEIKFTEGNFEMDESSIKNSLIEDGICAPTIRQFFSWVREIHSIYSSIHLTGERKFRFSITTLGDKVSEENSTGGRYDSYEECELESLRHCISLIQKRDI